MGKADVPLRIPFAHQNVQISRDGFHVDMNMTDDDLGNEGGDFNDYAVEVAFVLIPSALPLSLSLSCIRSSSPQTSSRH